MGTRIEAEIPNYDDHGLSFTDLDGFESVSHLREGERPGKELDEYRFRLGRARRRAIEGRLRELATACEGLLVDIAALQ